MTEAQKAEITKLATHYENIRREHEKFQTNQVPTDPAERTQAYVDLHVLEAELLEAQAAVVAFKRKMGDPAQ